MVSVLSVKLIKLVLKIPLEAASSMASVLTGVMKDESFNSVAPGTGTKFQNLTLHCQMYISTYKVCLDHSPARHGERIDSESLGKEPPFPQIHQVTPPLIL